MQTPYKVSQIGRPVFLHLEDDKRQIYVKKKLKRLQNQVHNVFSLEGWGGGVVSVFSLGSNCWSSTQGRGCYSGLTLSKFR